MVGMAHLVTLWNCNEGTRKSATKFHSVGRCFGKKVFLMFLLSRKLQGMSNAQFSK